MQELKVYKKVDLVNPVMLAAWPGMGNVALEAVSYIRTKLKAVKFAEIKLDGITTLDSVEIEDGIARLPNPPRNVFYYTKNPDLIIFESEVQLPGEKGIEVLDKVIDVAAEFKTSRVYVGAAFPLPIGHKDEPEVYGAVNMESLRDTLVKSGIKPLEGGHISGLNGLMLGFAGKKGIEAICMLATMPQYAIGIPNPKASYAIVEALSKVLNIVVDLQELTEYVKDMEERMGIIEEKVKDTFTIEDEQPESPPTDKKIPGYIMEKIEKLFHEANADKSKAALLKKELDRWDLYKLYEDRFLDLFKENQ